MSTPHPTAACASAECTEWRCWRERAERSEFAQLKERRTVEDCLETLGIASEALRAVGMKETHHATEKFIVVVRRVLARRPLPAPEPRMEKE